MKLAGILTILFSLMACAPAKDATQPDIDGYPFQLGTSQDIRALWLWQSGEFKMRDLGESEYRLDLTAVNYDAPMANHTFEFVVASGGGQFVAPEAFHGTFTFMNTDLAWIDFNITDTLDCDADPFLPCDQAPNGTPIAYPTGSWDGTMVYHSDGTRLYICMDEACGVYLKQ